MDSSDQNNNSITLPVTLSDTKTYVVATFSFSIEDVLPSPTDSKNLQLSVCSDEFHVLLLCYEDDDKENQKIIGECNIPCDVIASAAKSKCFSLIIDSGFNQNKIYVCLNHYMFVQLAYINEPISFRPRKEVCKVFNHFGCFIFQDFDDDNLSTAEYIDMLYERLCNQRDIVTSVTHQFDLPGFLPKLRDYQKAAVLWMLQRETKPINVAGQLHPLFVEYQTLDGQIIFAHKSGGFFVKERFAMTEQLRGGILADEMGLGKTLEVLALVLLNPQPNEYTKNNFQVPCSPFPACDDCMDSSNDVPVAISQGHKKFVSSANMSHDFFCTCGKVKSFKKTLITCSRCNICHHLECMYTKPGIAGVDPYVCPFCIVEESQTSRATLIVSPAAISHQWYSEIQRHTAPGTLKVYCYGGVKKEKFVPPSVLADQDVVIVTYETFRQEVKYVGVQRSTSDNKRHRQKYAALPSPLTAVDWWRICLDEAQMVESSSTKPAKMALQLKSRHSWCVTGTPIQKSVTDLYGIFLFLGYEPYIERKWFNEVLYKPFCHGDFDPFTNILKDVFWRTLKKDVSDQIGLLPQTEIRHELTFSSVEQYFYDRQRDSCVSEFCRQVQSIDPSIPLKSLDRKSFCQIMTPLYKLRKACCHPQAVKGQFTPLNKSIMSMEEISEALVGKTEMECGDTHRCYIAAVNGLAGVKILENDLFGAIEAYIDVLDSVESQKQHFPTDKLQQLHSLYNLAIILKQVPGGDLNTNKFVSLPSGISLPSKFKSIKDIETKEKYLCAQYLSKYQELMCTAQRKLSHYSLKVKELMNTVNLKALKNDPWWKRIFDEIQENKSVEFVQKLKLSLDSFADSPFLAEANDLNGLSYVCFLLFQKLLEMQEELSKDIQSLSNLPTDKDVNVVVDCHLRPVSGPKVKCQFCSAQDVFNLYENQLFNVTEKKKIERRKRHHSPPPEDADGNGTEETDDSVSRYGNWGDGLAEQFFKNILSLARSYRCNIPEESSKTMELFDSLKKEFKALRGTWMEGRNYISAIDELNMAKTRFRFTDNTSEKHDMSFIAPSMLPLVKANLIADKSDQNSKLETLISRLSFLKNLVREHGTRNDPSSDVCPVCRNAFEPKFSVLRCGHRLCILCLDILIKMQQRGATRRVSEARCPVCRLVTNHSDIHYLGEESRKKSVFNLKGSHSTKIHGILDSLLKIQHEDCESKTVIFSSFSEMLDVLEEALRENNILFVNLAKCKNFQQDLEKFKCDKQNNVLLLPIKSGANGLNITEATTVFLVEPLLNSGLTAQAISRIHRIGQQKQTSVHYFYVKGTIEEKIAHSSRKTSVELISDVEPTSTIQHMKDLFLTD